jgi:hypothetical protein
MCLWAVRHVQFEKLSGKQKTDLKKKLRARKKVVQAQLSDVNRAIKHATRKSK